MRIGNLFTFGLAMLTICTAFAEDDAAILLQKRKTVTSQRFVERKLDEKQLAVPAEEGNYVILYPNSTGTDEQHDEDGEINKRHISQTLTVGNNGGDGVNAAGLDIPTVGAVNAGLNTKQQKLSGDPGQLVTYTSTEGTVGATDVYSTATGTTYATQTESLVRAQDVNGAVTNGFAGLLTCNGWDSTTHDDAHCITYSVNTNMASGTYVPQGPASQGGGT